MADNQVNGAEVTRKAIFLRSVSQGKTKYRRAPFNIVTRLNNSTGQTSTYMELVLGGGHTPGRANSWDDSEGELYDAVEYYDSIPVDKDGNSLWPRIGIVAG